jgi:hypothetical protein
VGDYGLLGAWDGHVDVLAEDHLALRHPAQRLYHVLVALLVRDLLVLVTAEGVGACGGQRGVAGRGPRADAPAQLAQVPLGLGGRGARGSLDLHHRLEELVGDELAQLVGEAAHDLLDLLDQLPVVASTMWSSSSTPRE